MSAMVGAIRADTNTSKSTPSGNSSGPPRSRNLRGLTMTENTPKTLGPSKIPNVIPKTHRRTDASSARREKRRGMIEVHRLCELVLYTECQRSQDEEEPKWRREVRQNARDHVQATDPVKALRCQDPNVLKVALAPTPVTNG